MKGNTTDTKLCIFVFVVNSEMYYAGKEGSYLSVTMSKTAPNLDVCPSARAA